MPRSRKPPVQQFPTGLPYGRQQQLQQQAAAVPVPRGAATRGPALPAPTAPAQDPRAAAMQGMAQLPALPPLSAPTQRRFEPITAGLPVGAGPGPEAIAPLGPPRAQSPADMMARLAAATGDPKLMAAANAARGWR